MPSSLSIVILAAGNSSRMKSPTPKILHKVAGTSMLERIVGVAKSCSPEQIIVVHHPSFDPMTDLPVKWIPQDQPKGTAHALEQALPLIPDHHQVLILYGDVPLITLDMIQPLCDQGLCLLTTTHPKPKPFGRIIRDTNQVVVGIVEGVDASEQEARICEIWAGVMSGPCSFFKEAIPHIKTNNKQKEYYLTAILPHWKNTPIQAFHTEDYQALQGVNTMEEKSQVERYAQQQMARKYMSMGLDIVDPMRFDCRGTLAFGEGCRIEPNVILEGHNQLGTHVTIEAFCHIKDSVIMDHSVIKTHSVLQHAQLAAHVQIGPFAHLRQGTHCDTHSKIGAFVETKATHVGAYSKAMHLSYLGDTTIGTRVNVGAGVITCNYDGKNKHKTNIKDGAFIGSGVQLIAPITIGENAYIGAGSTLRKNAASQSLTLTMGQVKVVENWKKQDKDDA